MGDHPQVRAALAAVDEEHYTLRPDGSLVRQSTAASAIARMLERLDVRPGMRVLEIGTGSGFSGALLSELAGPEGAVVSVDVVAELNERARDLHKARGRTNITLITGDGALGAPGEEPFDRIVAWTTPQVLPRAWVEQAAPGAVVLTPVELAPSVRTAAVLRAHVNRAGVPEGEKLFAGRYVEMHGQELKQWLVPPRGVDALVRAEDGRELWISAPWAAEDGDAACDMLAALADGPTEEVPVLEPEESAADLTAYLYARHAEDIGVVGLGGYAWGVGRADADGVAVFATAVQGSIVHGGGPGPLERLRAWVAAWREAGRPGYADLRPVLTREDAGWRVRAQLSNV
ncbi:protein-L-isoaspartate O-methyltransferase family protein [Nocardiopsis algeriensis]|uniref:protein-L-isoaspartate O-methyltransferase family protein n=1 Tax=Nocardiopsis algeriensis TaxID=1478215 RepID=UPI003B438437